MKEEMEEVEVLDTSHIIGDIFYLDSEIRNKYDKYPKIIGKPLAKIKRRKLIKIAKKLSEANVPLTKDNILEFIKNAYNNYSYFVGDDKIFHGVSEIEMHYEDEYLIGQEFIIIFNIDDDLSATLAVYSREEEFTVFMVVTKEDGSVNNYHINLNRLYSTNKAFGDSIRRINQHIMSLMSEYIVYTLENSNREV